MPLHSKYLVNKGIKERVSELIMDELALFVQG